jgi:ferredoxin--NADP+ reductase
VTPQIGSRDNPLQVAVIGSGPAGFYAAGELLSAPDVTVRVDMFDRLATPWGLVRAGVAPDHPKIKSVTRVYEKIASNPGFRFYGNVEVGNDVTHEELACHFHAVLYAVGAPTDRRLGIPGEELRGSHAATEFVGWYNGHPDYAHHTFDLSGRRAVVVGNGNVALDVARMLALTPQQLASTDIADHALEALTASEIEEVVVLGRRGPAQAAFTNPELRELGELVDADVVVDSAEVELDEHSAAFLDSDAADTAARRNVEILHDYAKRESTGKRKRIVLRFLLSPLEILGDGRVEGLRVVRNKIELTADGAMVARATEDVDTIEADLVFRSIGYRGVPIPGVPFDERQATIHNVGGRVTDPQTGAVLSGVYAAGWAKRGPSGVIGTNKKCARETVDLLLEDAAAGRLSQPKAGCDELVAQIVDRGVELVNYVGWEAIDAYERRLGESRGRPRVKLVRREELLARAIGRFVR